jgi:hypothetical protein
LQFDRVWHLERKVVERICNKHKQKLKDFTKCKNLMTTKYSDFDEADKARIQQQVLNSVSVASETVSIALSITGVTGATGSTPSAYPSKSDQKCVIFLYNASALSSYIHCPILPVTIQSGMPHIQLQLGMDINNSSCPSIRCVVDTAAALCTGRYHFFSAIMKWFPQCVEKIFLP